MPTSTLQRPTQSSEQHTSRRVRHRDLPATAPETVRSVRIMGVLSVDSIAARNTKPLEFVTALALAGGRMGRDALVRRLYLSTACDSAIPTLCYRARKMGIDVSYDCSTATYVLRTDIRVDALTILELLRDGDVRSALDLWGGSCLAASDSPLARALRSNLEQAMVDAVLGTGDQDLVRRAARTIDSIELAEVAAETGGDVMSMILAQSFVEGTLA